MSDFIILDCPVCGGGLNFVNVGVLLSCEYCDTECILKTESGDVILEYYPKCPICLRTDRVKKVSVIIHNIYNSSDEMYVDKNSPLYFDLTPPPEPIERDPVVKSGKKKKERSLGVTCLFYILGIPVLLFVGFMGLFVIPVQIFIEELDNLGLLMGYWLFIGFLVLMIVIRLNKKKQQEKKLLIEQYDKAKKQAHEDYSSRLLPEWKRKMDIWNELFYCFRDDIVFNPTSKKVFKSEELKYQLN